MRTVFAIIGVLILIGIGAVVYYTVPSAKDALTLPALGGVKPSELSGTAPIAEPLSGEYKNEKYAFSLKVPEGYTAQELQTEANGADTVIIQNNKGEGIQILVTPYGEDLAVLTADMIQADIPDMKISNVEAVTVGPSNKGVAFLSDSAAFQGNSREVWFVFRGNLYQISTYARLDPLLKAMFATWKFF